MRPSRAQLGLQLSPRWPRSSASAAGESPARTSSSGAAPTSPGSGWTRRRAAGAARSSAPGARAPAPARRRARQPPGRPSSAAPRWQDTEMTPLPPQAMKGSTVKSSPDSSVSRVAALLARCPRRAAMLPVASLSATTSGMSHSRSAGLRQQVHAGAARHVVGDEREARVRLRDRPVVLDQARLRGLVVVGRDDQRAVGAELAHAPHALDGLRGAVGARAGDHRHPALARPRPPPGRRGRARRRSWSPPRRWSPSGRAPGAVSICTG